MKFTYQYKTSDGTRHAGVFSAPTREAAYDGLRGKGIRAFGVEPAPGLLNRLSGYWGWRLAAAVLFAAAAAAATLAYLRGRGESAADGDPVFLARTRRQIIGDTAVIEDGIRNGWRDVFPGEGERFLASFAIPGVPAGVRATNVAEMEAALKRTIAAGEDDAMEVKQIKSMVEGMKDELRRYIAKGGTIEKYGERLVERQEQELAYYRRVKEEVDSAVRSGSSEEEVERIWKNGNAELRNMGIKLVPLPEAF